MLILKTQTKFMKNLLELNSNLTWKMNTMLNTTFSLIMKKESYRQMMKIRLKI